MQFPDCRSSAPCWKGDVSVLLVLALVFVLPCRKPDVPRYWKLCLVLFFGVWFLLDQFTDLACLCEVLLPAWGRGQPMLHVGFNVVKTQKCMVLICELQSKPATLSCHPQYLFLLLLAHESFRSEVTWIFENSENKLFKSWASFLAQLPLSSKGAVEVTAQKRCN